ncbi:MAG TPA: ATP-binding cassette domain-containing protein [Caulobacteraceae bacterium]|jgi:cell division transport system ATP-binding protein
MSRTGDIPSSSPEAHTTEAAPDSPIVRFSGVGLRYGGAPEVLSDLNFDLRPGSFHFLTGASGAGKTTLLRLMQLDLKPSRGLIGLFGQDVARLKRSELPFLRRRVGVVLHDRRLLAHLDAFENVALPPRLAGRKSSDYGPDVDELLAWVGLSERAKTMPAALSSGEQQRLAIARAVVSRPELLLADEPTAGVDQDMALRILRLFVELNRLGTTVLIATHDEELIARSGKPVMRIEEGELTVTPAP